MRDINFFEEIQVKNKLLNSNYVRIFIFVLTINIILMIISNYQFLKTKLYKESLQMVLLENEQIITLEELEEEEGLYNELEYLKEENQNLLKNTYEISESKKKIESIINLVPENLFIKTLSLDPEEIIISGECKDKIKIYNFYKLLRGLEFSNKLMLDQIYKINETYVFNISLKVG